MERQIEIVDSDIADSTEQRTHLEQFESHLDTYHAQYLSSVCQSKEREKKQKIKSLLKQEATESKLQQQAKQMQQQIEKYKQTIVDCDTYINSNPM